ncbi:MAG TPA: hypothetical protein PJ994_07210, partial [Tepidiformaceae bacterium]|nr:hypothetical protein [Tepidiformaceae bacterium]
MCKRTAKRSAFWAAPALVVGVALFFGLSGDASPSPTRVSASPSASGSLGYFDSVRHTSFAVEVDTGSPLEGWFLLAVPGTGLYWPDGAATVTVEVDGSLSLSYSGDAFFDDTAEVDGTFGWLHAPSGLASVVSVSLSGTISEDQGTIDVSLTHGIEVYTVESEPAPETADMALDDTIDFLEMEDFESLYGQIIPFFHEEITEQDYITEAEAYFGEYGTISAVALLDSVVYELNPSYGPQYARAKLEVEFSTGGGPLILTMPVVYLWYDEEWLLAEIGGFVEEGWVLAFGGYPGLEVVDAEFTVEPYALIVQSNGYFAYDDNSTEVTLSLSTSPDGATLTCADPLTQQVSGGRARWEECTVDKVGTYVLRIAADGFEPLDGDEIKVVALTGQLHADGQPVTLAQVIPGSGALFFIEPDGESDYSIVVESTEPTVKLLLRGPSWHVRARTESDDGLTYLEFRAPWDLLVPENTKLSAWAPGEFFVEHTARMFVIPADATDTIALDGEPHDAIAHVLARHA